jgi:hypothetical protein
MRRASFARIVTLKIVTYPGKLIFCWLAKNKVIVFSARRPKSQQALN